MYTDATNLGMTRCCWHSLVSSVSLQHLQQSPGSCGESRCASPGTERKAQHGSTTNSLIFFFTHPVRQVVLNLKQIRTVQYLKNSDTAILNPRLTLDRRGNTQPGGSPEIRQNQKPPSPTPSETMDSNLSPQSPFQTARHQNPPHNLHRVTPVCLKQVQDHQQLKIRILKKHRNAQCV